MTAAITKAAQARPEPRNRHSRRLAPSPVTMQTDLRSDRTAMLSRAKRLGQLAAVLMTMVAAEAAANFAAAQSVPLPRPAPKARNAATASSPQQTTPSPNDGANQPLVGTAPKPFKPQAMPVVVQPDTRPTNTTGVFNAEQRAIATRVSSYLSSVSTLVGNFVQVAPNGNRTTGDFYIQKPGKVRFEYNAPSPIAVVADGSSVIVRDRKLATQDLYPLSQTPLRFLLSDRIDLLRDTNLVGVSADDTYVTVTIEEKQPLVGTSRLMLMLGAKDNVLKQWTVTDPQGYDTTVAVYNLDASNKPLDPGLFKIDYQRYDAPPQ